jgi:hypothetical protein
MADVTKKVILETVYKTTVEGEANIKALQTATDKLTESNLEKVAADKKLEQAANQLNKVVDTQTQKQSALAQSVEKTGKAMAQVAAKSTLKEAFSGTDKQIAMVTAQLDKFKESARAAKSVDELTVAIDELMASLPEEVRADAFKLIQKETEKLEKTLERPTSRLRELKRLINTETDPVLLKKLTAEAAKLQDELGDTNDVIKALASDTLFTDTLVQGAQTATAAFSAFQGVTTLFAEDNEELAKAAQKAQGAMAALLGIQQLSIEFKKADNIVTRSQILLQKGYAAVVGQSTGAMKGFKLALAATGIGLAVIALGYLVANFDKVKYALGFGVNPETERYIKLSREATAAAEQEIVSFQNQAEALRLLADRRKNLNADITAGSVQRFNEEINIINRETEKLQGALTEREKQIDDEIKKLNELKEARQKALVAESSAKAVGLPGPLASLLFGSVGPSDAEVKAQEDEVTRLNNLQEEQFVNTLANNNKIDEINRQKTELLKANLKKQNDDRIASLAEEERHALAEANILKKSEEEILRIQLFYLQKRKALLLQIGGEGASELAIKKINNELEELQLTINNLKPVVLFEPGSIKAMEAQLSAINDAINSLGEGPLTTNLARQAKEIEKQIQESKDRIFGISKELNFELFDEEERHHLAMLQGEKDYEQKQIALQIQFAKNKLAILIAAGKGEELEAIRIRNTIQELQKQQSDYNAAILQKQKDDREKYTRESIRIATSLATTLLDIEIKRYEGAIAAQQQRVDAATKIAEKGNAELLEQEQNRLDELTRKKEKFVKNQQRLAKLELIANTIVTVSKAAAEGGVAAAFTIAAALAALFAGLAVGTAQANSQSFKKGGVYDSKGGYTGYGPASGQSLALGPKPYDYHFKEHIMPAEVTGIGNNIDWLEKIRLNRIDIGKLVSGKGPVYVNDNRAVVAAIEGIESTKVSVNMNSKGIINIVKEASNRKKVIDSRR